MTDQMPDEVWVDDYCKVWKPEHGLIPGDAVRYIRADLYDSKACPHVVGGATQHCTLAQDEVRRLTQRAEQAEAERDRLRAVLADIADDPYDYQRVQDAAQEALDHD